MKKTTLVLFFLTVIIVNLSGATIISGIVVDYKTKKILKETNLFLTKYPNIGTISNDEGKFFLKIPSKYILPLKLSAKFVGYEDKHIIIHKNHKKMIISLNPKIFELKEVSIEAKQTKIDLVFNLAHNSPITSIAVVKSNKEKFICSASLKGVVKLWNTKGQLLRNLKISKKEGNSFVFNFNNKIIGIQNNKIKIWNLNGDEIYKKSFNTAIIKAELKNNYLFILDLQNLKIFKITSENILQLVYKTQIYEVYPRSVFYNPKLKNSYYSKTNFSTVISKNNLICSYNSNLNNINSLNIDLKTGFISKRYLGCTKQRIENIVTSNDFDKIIIAHEKELVQYQKSKNDTLKILNNFKFRSIFYRNKYKDIKNFNPYNFLPEQNNKNKFFFLCQGAIFEMSNDLNDFKIHKNKIKHFIQCDNTFFASLDNDIIREFSSFKELDSYKFKIGKNKLINNNKIIRQLHFLDSKKTIINCIDNKSNYQYSINKENFNITPKTIFDDNFSQTFVKPDSLILSYNLKGKIGYGSYKKKVNLIKSSGIDFYREDIRDPGNRLRQITRYAIDGVLYTYYLLFKDFTGKEEVKKITIKSDKTGDYYSDHTRQEEYFDDDFSFMTSCDYLPNSKKIIITYDLDKILVLNFNDKDSLLLSESKLKELPEMPYNIDYLAYSNKENTFFSGSNNGNLSIHIDHDKIYTLKGLNFLIQDTRLGKNFIYGIDYKGNIAVWDKNNLEKENYPLYTKSIDYNNKTIISCIPINEKKQLLLVSYSDDSIELVYLKKSLRKNNKLTLFALQDGGIVVRNKDDNFYANQKALKNIYFVEGTKVIKDSLLFKNYFNKSLLQKFLK